MVVEPVPEVDPHPYIPEPDEEPDVALEDVDDDVYENKKCSEFTGLGEDDPEPKGWCPIQRCYRDTRDGVRFCTDFNPYLSSIDSLFAEDDAEDDAEEVEDVEEEKAEEVDDDSSSDFDDSDFDDSDFDDSDEEEMDTGVEGYNMYDQLAKNNLVAFRAECDRCLDDREYLQRRKDFCQKCWSNFTFSDAYWDKSDHDEEDELDDHKHDS